MDELARFNRERWEELAAEQILYSRPRLDLDAASARALVDPQGVLGPVAGRDVLCLAGGGGQQSAAFGLLEARVTVLDLCDTQLARDRETAEHYGIDVRTVQGDMRDLSVFGENAFDLVWHAHSLTFIPEPAEVFAEVARGIRDGGLYRLHCTNPFFYPLVDNWNGSGYELRDAYADGEVISSDPHWDFEKPDGTRKRVRGPREFRHTFSTVINALVAHGFSIQGFWEEGDQPGATDTSPGSWAHFLELCPPWTTYLSGWSARA